MKKILLGLFVIAVHSAAMAQKPAVITSDKAGWQKIGEVTASFKVEKDGISVLGKDRFKSIKLRVTDAPINIYDVEVYYENGETEHLEVKTELKAGDDTRAINLKGNSMEIKKVVFTYKSVANMDSDKAHVELYGMK
ncbi:MAG: hypothetical protein ABI772_08580 [Bacteroidota bacterium]